MMRGIAVFISILLMGDAAFAASRVIPQRLRTTPRTRTTNVTTARTAQIIKPTQPISSSKFSQVTLSIPDGISGKSSVLQQLMTLFGTTDSVPLVRVSNTMPNLSGLFTDINGNGGNITGIYDGNTRVYDASGNFKTAPNNNNVNMTVSTPSSSDNYTITYTCGDKNGTPPAAQRFAVGSGSHSLATADDAKSCITDANDKSRLDTWKCGSSYYGAGYSLFSSNTDVTCVAQWTTNPLITFSCGDGTGYAPAKHTAVEVMGKMQTQMPDADGCTYAGHTFAGWECTGLDGIKNENDTIIVTGNTTCTATWTAGGNAADIATELNREYQTLGASSAGNSGNYSLVQTSDGVCMLFSVSDETAQFMGVTDCNILNSLE